MANEDISVYKLVIPISWIDKRFYSKLRKSINFVFNKVTDEHYRECLHLEKLHIELCELAIKRSDIDDFIKLLKTLVLKREDRSTSFGIWGWEIERLKPDSLPYIAKSLMLLVYYDRFAFKWFEIFNKLGYLVRNGNKSLNRKQFKCKVMSIEEHNSKCNCGMDSMNIKALYDYMASNGHKYYGTFHFKNIALVDSSNSYVFSHHEELFKDQLSLFELKFLKPTENYKDPDCDIFKLKFLLPESFKNFVEHSKTVIQNVFVRYFQEYFYREFYIPSFEIAVKNDADIMNVKKIICQNYKKSRQTLFEILAFNLTGFYGHGYGEEWNNVASIFIRTEIKNAATFWTVVLRDLLKHGYLRNQNPDSILSNEKELNFMFMSVQHRNSVHDNEIQHFDATNILKLLDENPSPDSFRDLILCDHKDTEIFSLKKFSENLTLGLAI